MKAFGLLILMIMLSGCAPWVSRLKPLEPGATVQGRQAEGSTLTVKSQIRWYYSNPPSYEELARVPAGNYTVEGADRTYIYYKAPAPVYYSIRMSHYAQDRKKREGPGGIYIRRTKRKGGNNVGAYLTTDKGAERVLEGFERFFEEEGKTWTLKEK